MNANLITETLNKFQITDQDITRIRDSASVLRPQIPEHTESFYVWMKKHNEYKVYFADQPNG